MKPTFTYDANLLLNDGAASHTASYAGLVGGAAKIIDIGAGNVEGKVVVDVTALDVDTGEEVVSVGVQVSSSSTFASDYYEVATLKLGDAAVIAGDVDMTTGRYVIPFKNTIADGTTKQYLRIYFTLSGTIAGFNCVAYIAA